MGGDVAIIFKIHHGGKFVRDPKLKYVDGEILKWKVYDVDRVGYFRIEKKIRSMGYFQKPKIYWLPRGSLIENGLRFIYNDDFFYEIIPLIEVFEVVHMELFIEHVVDEPEIINVPLLALENVVVSSDDEMEDINADNDGGLDEMQDANADRMADGNVLEADICDINSGDMDLGDMALGEDVSEGQGKLFNADLRHGEGLNMVGSEKRSELPTSTEHVDIVCEGEVLFQVVLENQRLHNKKEDVLEEEQGAKDANVNEFDSEAVCGQELESEFEPTTDLDGAQQSQGNDEHIQVEQAIDQIGENLRQCNDDTIEVQQPELNEQAANQSKCCDEDGQVQ